MIHAASGRKLCGLLGGIALLVSQAPGQSAEPEPPRALDLGGFPSRQRPPDFRAFAPDGQAL
jgi:hypothetical protein